MTPPDAPCSDVTRRWLFTTLRQVGIRDHHVVLPWCGLTSLSRESGVTEGQICALGAWVARGMPEVEVSLDPRGRNHQVNTYLPDGDLEIAVVTTEELDAMPAPVRRAAGRVRLPAPVVQEPEAERELVVTSEAPQASAVTPQSASRPIGRVRLRLDASPVAEPRRPPLSRVVVTESLPAPVATSTGPRPTGRIRLRAPAPVVPEPVVAPVPEPLVDLSGHSYVRPLDAQGNDWTGRGRRRGEPCREPEPHGPPCPFALHPHCDPAAIPF